MSDLTQDELSQILKVVKRLDGTSDDLYLVLDEEYDLDPHKLSKAWYAYFDTKLGKCDDCECWAHPSHIKTDEEDGRDLCYSCQ